MKQPNLLTPRLLLRPYTLADAPDVQRLAGDRRVAEHTLNIPHPYEDGMAESWISQLRGNWEMRSAITYAISERSSTALMGAVSITRIEVDDANLGYWVGLPYWGQGFCTEAASALVDFARSGLGITHIRGIHLLSNPASGRVMQKMGWHYMGVSQTPDRNGEMADVAEYQSSV